MTRIPRHSAALAVLNLKTANRTFVENTALSGATRVRSGTSGRVRMAYLFKFVAAPSPRRRRVFDCWTFRFRLRRPQTARPTDVAGRHPPELQKRGTPPTADGSVGSRAAEASMAQRRQIKASGPPRRKAPCGSSSGAHHPTSWPSEIWAPVSWRRPARWLRTWPAGPTRDVSAARHSTRRLRPRLVGLAGRPVGLPQVTPGAASPR
jgi:hypothetical protein